MFRHVLIATLCLQLLIYVGWATTSIVINYFMLFVVGLMVNGPYALITTSVSAELGELLKSYSKERIYY